MIIKLTDEIYSFFLEDLDPINDCIEIIITKVKNRFYLSDFGYFYDEFIKYLPDKERFLNIKNKYQNIDFENEEFLLNSSKDEIFDNIILFSDFLKELSDSIKKVRNKNEKNN